MRAADCRRGQFERSLDESTLPDRLRGGWLGWVYVGLCGLCSKEMSCALNSPYVHGYALFIRLEPHIPRGLGMSRSFPSPAGIARGMHKPCHQHAINT